MHVVRNFTAASAAAPAPRAAVLAKLSTDAREQHREAKRLGDVIVGARFKPQDGVGIGVVGR